MDNCRFRDSHDEEVNETHYDMLHKKPNTVMGVTEGASIRSQNAKDY